MPEVFPDNGVAITEGTPGKRFHTWGRTIQGTVLQDQFVIPSEPASRTVSFNSSNVPVTSNDNILMLIWANVSVWMRVHYFWVGQNAQVTGGGTQRMPITLLRWLVPNGIEFYPTAYDTDDAAWRLETMAQGDDLSSTFPAEYAGEVLMRGYIAMGASPADTRFSWEWTADFSPIVVPPGTGLAWRAELSDSNATIHTIAEATLSKAAKQ